MKNNKISYSITAICTLACIVLTTHPKPRIVCTIKPFATKNKDAYQGKEISQEKFSASLKKPGKVGNALLRDAHHHTPANVGIFGTYWGYIGVTDFMGTLGFIRHTIKPKVKLLITRDIQPIMMFGTVVHHFTLKPGNPAALYSLERVDDKNGKAHWITEQLPVEPDQPISLDTIVIFAHPNFIEVPLGTTATRRDPNLILPPIFAKPGIEKVANALRVLTIRHFFSPVRFVDKKVDNTYYSDLLRP